MFEIGDMVVCVDASPGKGSNHMRGKELPLEAGKIYTVRGIALSPTKPNGPTQIVQLFGIDLEVTKRGDEYGFWYHRFRKLESGRSEDAQEVYIAYLKKYPFAGPIPGYEDNLSPEEEERDERKRKRMAEKWRKRAHVMAYEMLRKGQILGGEERYARFMETISNKEFSACDIDREIGILENEYSFSIRYPHMASKPYRPL